MDQRRGARHGDQGARRAPARARPRPINPGATSRATAARRPIAPLAAVEASAQAAAEAAAGLLLSAAALAADTVAAVLSPTELATEMLNRATRCERGSESAEVGEADPDRLDRPRGSEPRR